jgi:hypothetical protein
MDWIERGLTAVGFLLTFALGWLGYRRATRNDRMAQRRAAVEESSAQFKDNLELNRYIDARVEERLADLRQEMSQLRQNERIRTGAFISILHTIARQWPDDHPLPVLDPTDIKAVEDTIPAQWLAKPRRRRAP